MLLLELCQLYQDTEESNQIFTERNERQKQMVSANGNLFIKEDWRDIFWREASYHAGFRISRTTCRA